MRAPEYLGKQELKTTINLVDIAPDFVFIQRKGFVEMSSRHDPQSFGNATLIEAGSFFSLQFTRDRGQVFVDIGSDSFGWHKLEYVLEFVDNSIMQQKLGEPPDPLILAKLLKEHWNKVVQLFSDPQKLVAFKDFAAYKSEVFLKELHKRSSSIR
jgi:hypothetical protein